jgi:hypothetical protein
MADKTSEIKNRPSLVTKLVKLESGTVCQLFIKNLGLII